MKDEATAVSIRPIRVDRITEEQYSEWRHLSSLEARLRATLITESFPAPAILRLQGWHGYSEQAIIVVGKTPKHYRIETASADGVRLAGRRRWLRAGETVLVPKTAVQLVKETFRDR